jgi:IS30 family transposase
LPRGELRRELVGCLRHAKPVRGRKPKGSELRGKLCGMTNIKDRPEEVKGRLVPGHWGGDLIPAGLAGEQMKSAGDVRSGT